MVNRIRPSRRPLWAILVIFLIPLIAAIFVTIFRDKLSFQTRQKGNWVNPPFSIQLNSASRLDKPSPGSSFSHPNWHLVYLEAPNCNEECQQQKYLLSQLHKALGKYRARLQVSSTEATNVHAIEPKGYQALILNKNNTLLIDPHGQVILHYNQHITVNNILKDLRQLLKS